jgi:hypothetical protein
MKVLPYASVSEGGSAGFDAADAAIRESSRRPDAPGAKGAGQPAGHAHLFAGIHCHSGMREPSPAGRPPAISATAAINPTAITIIEVLFIFVLLIKG